MAGCFITFEGTEGCGKSTHIKKLARRLEAEGHTVRTLREPGGTESGESIRQLLKHGPEELTAEAELLLMNASRAQLVREVIRPAIAAGEIVLSDRFYDSTTVYQGTGRGLDAAQVQAVIDFAVGDTRPVLTLLLQIPLKTSEERRARRSETPLKLPEKPPPKRLMQHATPSRIPAWVLSTNGSTTHQECLENDRWGCCLKFELTGRPN